MKNNIKYFREQVGLSQQELAERIGKAKSTVCRYEKNEIRTPDIIKTKIAKELQASIIDIFFNKGVEYNSMKTNKTA